MVYSEADAVVVVLVLLLLLLIALYSAMVCSRGRLTALMSHVTLYDRLSFHNVYGSGVLTELFGCCMAATT